MTNKKVRVFWPVDQQWYIATVQQYNPSTLEHLLQYPDGDTEWVRIGEDHTTNTGYKEYFNALKGSASGESGLKASLSGISFAFSGLGARSMSQGLALPETEEEKPLRSKQPLKKHSLQLLPLDRTASSMSSFGFNSGGIGRLPSFALDGRGVGGPGAHPPYQLIDPAFTHSFSSRKAGEVPPMDLRGGKGGPDRGSWDPRFPPHRQSAYRVGHPHEPYSYGYPPHQRSEQSGTNRPPHRPSQQYPPGYYEGSMPPHLYPPYHAGDGSRPPPPPPPSSSEPSRISPANPSDRKRKDTKHPSEKQSTPRASSNSGSTSPPPVVLGENGKPKKAPTVAWTKDEDEHLLDIVLQMKHPLKWSLISSTLNSDRTGKQCRERYVNHLNPRLKNTDWTPTEDATIWRLYATVGSQWAKMSKVIPGRTDNGIKNRFHNLKRQLDREEESRVRAPRPENYELKVRVETIPDISNKINSPIEQLWNVKVGIGKIAAKTSAMTYEEEESGAVRNDSETPRAAKFGPFYEVSEEPVQCMRCAMFVPSVQCGSDVCSKTGWCRMCTRVASMHLGGDTLRECLNLRKIQDQDRDVVDEMERCMREIRC